MPLLRRAGSREGGKNLFRQLPARRLPYREGFTDRPPLLWSGSTALDLGTASTSVDDDWNHSGRARLYQNFDNLLEARLPTQLHLSCCGILERQTRFSIPIDLVCSPGALLLRFGLSAEEASHTEGRCSQLLPPPAPNNPRNAGSTVACQASGAHTGAAQGAREEMYRSAELRRHSRPFRLVQFHPTVLGESRQFRRVAVLGDILFYCRRRGGVYSGSRRGSGRNGATRWDETYTRPRSKDQTHPSHP